MLRVCIGFEMEMTNSDRLGFSTTLRPKNIRCYVLKCPLQFAQRIVECVRVHVTGAPFSKIILIVFVPFHA